MTSDDSGASRHIVFLDRETLPEQVTVRPPAFAHTMDEHQRTRPEEVVGRAKDAEIVITNKVPLRADTLAELPKLKMIAVAATGTDIIDATVADIGAYGGQFADKRPYPVAAPSLADTSTTMR